MGVHTGDSITVAPAMTLTDRELQRLREIAKIVIRTVGVETGGSNIQFAVNPSNGRPVVIEMNPRVSRSSALASKATGFPIAKIAALLAVGYSLDEIPNDITKVTPASFEPSLDYVVVKVPRWAFEKFPGVDPTLGPQMKSVGEVMAIGTTFNEAFQKALRGLEIGATGFGVWKQGIGGTGPFELLASDQPYEKLLTTPTPWRIFAAANALRAGMSVEQLADLSGYDAWFVEQLAIIIALEAELSAYQLADLPADLLREAKQEGFSDAQIAVILGSKPTSELDVRAYRKALGILPVYHRIDTCAAEFEAHTPYLYSTYATQDESEPTAKPKVMILGGGPNRIGQGLEFDYCCVHACMALRELGYETIMVNCNPETVSTDYDTSDRLYFEPLTLEDVLNIWENENRGLGFEVQFDQIDTSHSDIGASEHSRGLSQVVSQGGVLAGGEAARRADSLTLSEKHSGGLSHFPQSLNTKHYTPILVQFGGQTPLNLARGLEAAGVPIWGTSPDAIDLAEDRGRFGELLQKLEIAQPESGMAHDLSSARRVAQRIGYPVLVRPSYVLGGRAMAIAYDDSGLARYIHEATAISQGAPVLIDRYLEDAFEVDVDAVGDGETMVIGGIMEHVEEAGVHSGDSAMVMPPYKVSAYHLQIIRDETIRLGLALGVRGLMNVQYAIKDDEVYVLEVNPRSSRTVPFVAKASGVPLASIAAKVASGQTLAELGLLHEPPINGFFVKEAVLPFEKFPGAAVFLSPEMRSTGEVMGHASSFGHAFAKAEMGAGARIPTEGAALLTVNDFDKGAIVRIARDLVRMGFTIYATRGTASWLRQIGVEAEGVNKVSEGSPHTVDLIVQGKVSLVVSTPLGSQAYADGQELRSAAVRYGVMLVTTLTGAAATVQAIRALRSKSLRVRSLQEHHGERS